MRQAYTLREKMLGRSLFRPGIQYAVIGNLSGGERTASSAATTPPTSKPTSAKKLKSKIQNLKSKMERASPAGPNSPDASKGIDLIEGKMMSLGGWITERA
jgi:hypothetical protein